MNRVEPKPGLLFRGGVFSVAAVLRSLFALRRSLLKAAVMLAVFAGEAMRSG
jgi:hypothetical protein